MKIKELINLLKQYPDYHEVKIVSDNWGASLNIKEVFSERKTYTYEEEEEIIINIKVDMGGL